MAKEHQRYMEEPIGGTALCYEVYRDQKNRNKRPFVQCAASDVMIVPGNGTDLDQLRQVGRKRVQRATLSKRPRMRKDLHGAINWKGGSLDDEMFLVVGPNLSVDDVLNGLDALRAQIRRAGLTVLRRVPTDFGFDFVFEQAEAGKDRPKNAS